jgi:hypothetical protein
MIIPPRQAGIIWANGNWQARLAAASICFAKNYKIIFKSEKTCWGCLLKVSIDNRTVASILDSSKSCCSNHLRISSKVTIETIQEQERIIGPKLGEECVPLAIE